MRPPRAYKCAFRKRKRSTPGNILRLNAINDGFGPLGRHKQMKIPISVVDLITSPVKAGNLVSAPRKAFSISKSHSTVANFRAAHLLEE